MAAERRLWRVCGVFVRPVSSHYLEQRAEMCIHRGGRFRNTVSPVFRIIIPCLILRGAAA